MFAFLNYFKKQLLNSMYRRYCTYKIQKYILMFTKKTVESIRVCAKLYWAEEMSIGSTVIMIATFYSVCNITDVMCVMCIKIQKKKERE